MICQGFSMTNYRLFFNLLTISDACDGLRITSFSSSPNNIRARNINPNRENRDTKNLFILLDPLQELYSNIVRFALR